MVTDGGDMDNTDGKREVNSGYSANRLTCVVFKNWQTLLGTCENFRKTCYYLILIPLVLSSITFSTF